jgi:hypothetical protein
VMELSLAVASCSVTSARQQLPSGKAEQLRMPASPSGT